VRVGLVLGAGGVTGHAFHAGVLAALAERTGFDPHDAAVLVGTSAGSSVAALLTAGLAPADLVARATGAPLSARARQVPGRLGASPPALDPPAPPRGVPSSVAALGAAALRPWRTRPGAVLAAALPEGRVSTAPIRHLVEHLHPIEWPSALRVCALDLDDGQRVVFDGRRVGAATVSVADAVTASCAIPGWYAPVVIGGRRYVDGGAWSPTNADVLGGSSLDVVVVSSPMSAAPRHALGRLDGPARLAFHRRLRRELVRLGRTATTVVVLEPTPPVLEAMGMNAMDPGRRHAVATSTLEAMRSLWRTRAPF
jgi:NTE family protein